MDALVAVENDPSSEALRDLFEWLSSDGELRGRLQLRIAPVQPDEMGASNELIAVALGSGGVGTVLARSLTTWLSQRKSDLVIKVTGRNGQTITVNARHVQDPLVILERAIGAVDGE
jgi:hypothetical protein